MENTKITEINQDEAEIKNLYEQVYAGMLEKNTKILDEILDNDMILIHITGYKQPKSEWLAEIDSENMKYFSREEKSVEIIINENFASLTAQNILDARIWGSRNHWRLQTIMEFEKIDGKWKIKKMKASTF